MAVPVVEIAGPPAHERIYTTYEVGGRLEAVLDVGLQLGAVQNVAILSEELIVRAMVYTAWFEAGKPPLLRYRHLATTAVQEQLALEMIDSTQQRGLKILPGRFDLLGQPLPIESLRHEYLVQMAPLLKLHPLVQEFVDSRIAAIGHRYAHKLIVLETSRPGRPDRAHTFWLQDEPAPGEQDQRPELDRLTVLYPIEHAVTTGGHIARLVEGQSWFTALLRKDAS